jgi:hypothetical protein
MGEPQDPSGAARLHIIVRRDEDPDDPQGGKGWAGNLGWLRWLIPAKAEALFTLPGAEAGRMLRMLERAGTAVTWSVTVIVTLFGAATAHLPPIGTIIIVVLEIVVPPLAVLRARGNDDDKSDS